MEQGALLFSAAQEEISDAAILRCKDLRCAIRMCIEVSGIAPKEIAFQLGMDAGHLSRMVNTSDDPRHFPPERLNELMDICGNEIPLRWQALFRGYGLYKLKSELEKELDAERREKEELKRELEIVRKWMVKQ